MTVSGTTTNDGMPFESMNSEGTKKSEPEVANISAVNPMPWISTLSPGVVETASTDAMERTWTNWQSLSGLCISAPAVASGGDDRLDVFSIGADSRLYHKWWDGKQWNSWKSLGDGTCIYKPAAISWGANRLDVFAINFDKQLYRKSWNGEQWNRWTSLGGTCVHGVAATSWGTNRIDLFTVGTNSVLYHKWWDGEQWNGWKPLKIEGQMEWEKSSTSICAPAAVSSKDRIDIFTLGIDNHVYHAWGDGKTWTGWQDMGGQAIHGVAVASRGANQIDLFTIGTDVEGTDNHLYHRSLAGDTWSNWKNLGGTCISAPAAIARGANRLDVFVTGTRSELWQKSWTKEGKAPPSGNGSTSGGGIGVSAKEENPGENALFEVAKAASTKTGLNIEFGSCKDIAVGWLGTNVHPLQELETIHQKAVREAVQPSADMQQRQNAEQIKLQSFFAFHSTEPALLSQDVSPNYSPVEQFTPAKNELEAISRDLKTSQLAQNNDPAYFNRIRTRLLNLLVEFDKIHSSFVNFPEYSYFREANVPILLKVEDALQRLRKNLDNQAKTCNDLKNLCSDLIADVESELGRAVEGLAKISMIFSIEPFYLFRLMVPFRVVSNAGVSDRDRRTASGKLTELINGLEWVPVWLGRKMVELDEALSQLDPEREDFFFYLKGGRALAHFLNDPGSGENDWDTGIVINPDLPAEYWHAIFNQVHNIVLEKLRKFKQEFFMLLHLHADEITTGLRDRPVTDDDLLEALHDSNLLADLLVDPDASQGGCKAELIDIGIPRRDSVEAREIWAHTRQYVDRPVNDMPVPGFLYYVDEYVFMVREFLAGGSPAPDKITKRVRRLFNILNTQQNPGVNGIIQAIRGQVRDTLPKAITYQPANLTRLIPILLKQFEQAYDLAIERDVAAIFDNDFVQGSQNLPNIPQDAVAKIQNDQQWNVGTHGTLLQVLVMAKQLSTKYEQYLQNRANFFGFEPQPGPPPQNRTLLETVVKTFCNQPVFAQANSGNLEVQLAVCGSFAAHLHAEYAQLTSASKVRLDPVSCIELKIFCWDRKAVPNAVRDAFVNPVLPPINAALQNNAFTILDGANGAKHLFWPQLQAGIQPLQTAHRPLAIKILVERNVWPQVAYVRGFPVLSLRDLVREYDQKAALAEEWARVQKLKDTSAVLRGLLTKFDY